MKKMTIMAVMFLGVCLLTCNAAFAMCYDVEGAGGVWDEWCEQNCYEIWPDACNCYPNCSDYCAGDPAHEWCMTNCPGHADCSCYPNCTYYRDADGDSYGNPSDTQKTYPQPAGYVSDNTDCDDSDNAVYPGASEACNGKDDNCDGVTPEKEADADNDGYRVCENDCDDGDNAIHPGASEACNGKDDNCDDVIPEDESDSDEDGHRACDDDCNDTDATIYTGATEICDGKDNDCDGIIPENEADKDEDGYMVCESCSDPYKCGDCDDNDEATHPGATEISDGKDNDCNGSIPMSERPSPTVTGITPTNNTTPIWNWLTGGGGNGSFRHKLDDDDLETNALATTEKSFTPSLALTDGIHILYVQEQNDSNDWSPSGSFAIEIDSGKPCSEVTAPSVTGTAAFEIEYSHNDIYKGENCDDGASGSGVFKVELYVKGPNDSEFPSDPTATDTDTLIDGSFDYTATDEGEYSFYTLATDKAGNTEELPSQGYDAKTVYTSQFPGYAILAVGSMASKEGLESHTLTANNIYRHLIERNFAMVSDKTDRWNDPLDHIRYFNPYDEIQVGEDDYTADGKAYEQALQEAITTWASSKMEAFPAPLYIILVDHGSKDKKFFLTGTQELEARELNDWLSDLEDKLTAKGIDQDIVVILGACYSGGFISNLSEGGRIIVSSTAADEPSYRGPSDPGGGQRDGEFFISALFNELGRGENLAASFENATERTEIHTYTGIDERTAPYFDTAKQHPHLDDNGDGKGSNELIPGGDGDKAEEIFLGFASTEYDPLLIATVGKDPSEPLSSDEALLWAEMSDNAQADKVWVEIRNPGLPAEEDAGNQVVINTKQETLVWNEENARYEVTYNGFTEPGKYTLFFYAKDKNTGIISPFVETYLYRTQADSVPPSEFSLVSPEDGASVQTTGTLDWTDAEDADGVTYTVLLSQGNDNFSDPIRKQDLIQSACFLDSDDNLTDAVDYYWKVQAIDAYGAVRESEVRKFRTDNTNAPPPALIQGYVYNPLTNRPVVNATLTVTPGSSSWLTTTLTTDSRGFYSGVLPPAPGIPTNEEFEAEITISAPGYNDTENTVNIVFSEQNTYIQLEQKFYDLDGDGITDLKDLVSAFISGDLEAIVSILKLLVGL